MERKELIRKVREMSMSMWVLGPLHGVHHWDRVYGNGKLLCKKNKDTDPFVVGLFAYLHDCCRHNDGNDDQHCLRASWFITMISRTLLRDVTDEQIMLLKKACELHTNTLRTGDPTIDTCFDADRLDLTRCGVIPDPFRMATRYGADIARQIQRNN